MSRLDSCLVAIDGFVLKEVLKTELLTLTCVAVLKRAHNLLNSKN